jgi:ribose transport system permease protein
MTADRFSAAEDVLTDALEREDDPQTDEAPSAPWRDILRNRDVAILLVALLLFAFFDLANSRMAAPETLISIARRVAPLCIVAAGMTMLFVAGEIDLSVGGLYGTLMVVISILIEKRDVNPWLAVLAIVVLGLGIGAFNGFLVTRVGVPSFIATLGTWVVLRGTGNLLSGGIASAATKTNLDYYLFFGSNVPGTRVPTIFALGLAVTLIVGLILARTKFGSDVYATGGDVEAARNNGIQTRRIKWACFVLVGGLVALAAALQFGRLANSPFNGGNGFELQVIAGVIIGGVGLFGGRGTVFGSFVGVLILSWPQFRASVSIARTDSRSTQAPPTRTVDQAASRPGTERRLPPTSAWRQRCGRLETHAATDEGGTRPPGTTRDACRRGPRVRQRVLFRVPPRHDR